jgi:PAS domain S-box-containing protein
MSDQEPKRGSIAPDALENALQNAFRSWELLPMAIYACDATGRLLAFNKRAAELWGREPKIGDDNELYCGSHRLIFAGRPIGRDETPMAHVLRTGEPVQGAEGIVIRPDGTRIWAMVHINPVRDENGRLIGAINCFHDITAQKETESRIREQDQRLNATYERATVGIAEVDEHGNRLRVNEMASQITGRTRHELLTGNIFEGMFAEDLATERPMFEALVRGELEHYTIDKRVTRKDGRVVWVTMLASAVRDADGKFLYSVRVFQDITDRKLIADALAANEQRLLATYETAMVSITEVDADGNILRVNETALELSRGTREQVLGRNIFLIAVPGRESEEDLKNFRALVSGEGGSYQCEKQIFRRDGTPIWVVISTSAVRDAEGRFLYAVRVMRDIDERKRAQEDLRHSEERYRNLLEALPAALYTTDAEGRITYYNQQAVDLWGKRPVLHEDKWCGSVKLFWPDGKPMPHDECPMAVALREGRELRNAEAVLERPDGTRVPFIPYPTLQRDDAGRITGAINMLVDITERKNAETRQRIMIDELNHRVKNTLATIQSFAKQSAVGAGSPEMFRERLVGRLIALSHAHDHLSRRSWANADLAEIAAAGLAPYQQEAADNIRIEGGSVELSPRAALVFSMIFHELATNAVKFGSLSDTAGKLALEWKHETEDGRKKLCVYWSESGGPEVQPPRHRGFGTMLVERGVKVELGGAASLDFNPQGVQCVIKVPVETPMAKAS